MCLNKRHITQPHTLTSQYSHVGMQCHVALRHMLCTSMIRMDLQEGARSNKCESTSVILCVYVSFKETSVVPPTILLLVHVIGSSLSIFRLLLWHFGSASLRLLSDFLFLRMCACYFISLALVSSWSYNASTTTGVLFYGSLRIAISSEVRNNVVVRDWHLSVRSRCHSFTGCVVCECA